MNIDRAFEINGLLVEAWLVRDGLRPGPPPSLVGVSLEEALEASRIVSEHPGEKTENGVRRKLHVAEAALPRLFAWSVLWREQHEQAGAQ